MKKINDTLQLMGALQPRLSVPTAIPNETYKIILDVKDGFIQSF